MKPSVTLSVCLLFAVTAAAFLYLDPQRVHENNPETLPAVKSSAKVFALGTGDEVVELTIERKQGEASERLSFQLSAKGWEMKQPVHGLADARLIEGMLTALRLMEKDRSLEPERGWEEYGLSAPLLRVGIRTKNSAARTLAFGAQSPVGDWVYARWEDEKEYFLVDPSLAKIFEPSLYSLREKRLFLSPSEKLQTIRIQTFKGDYEIMRQEGAWFWSEPVGILGESVPPEHMDVLFSQIYGLNIKEFMDSEKRSLQELGFAQGRAAIRLTTEGKLTEELRVGREVPLRDGFYARREGESAVLLLARSNLAHFFEITEKMASEAGEAAKKKESSGEPSGTH